MNSSAVSVLKHILNFKGSVKIVLKIKKWAQKNNSATLSPTGQNEAETSVLAKLSASDQDLVHCTGWPVCTLRILWHSDGSCRGIPPRHLNSPHNPQWNLFIPGDTFCVRVIWILTVVDRY